MLTIHYRLSLLVMASLAALLPGCRSETEVNARTTSAEAPAQDDHQHAHDDDHGEQASIELSAAALKNIGYKPYTVTLGDYERAISMPGMVVERPGKSQIRVSAPLGGVVTRSYAIQGEAVTPDSPLFDIRLTHEELVSAQGVFLESSEALDVVNAEIKRLEALTEGVIAQRRVLELKYERQKLEAKLRAQRQGLLLHGLSENQVDQILETRRLLKSLTVNAPSHEDCPTCHTDHPFHVQSLEVQTGEQVSAGDALCVLADHCELYIEGTAFEVDVQHLRDAVQSETPFSADVRVSAQREHGVGGLKLLYLADQVDRQSRALHFYVQLPNEIVSDRRGDSHRFVQWRFNPGQRVELSLPVERWSDRLVVPAEAVVSEGAESYVYRQSGDHFQRVPVHVEHRDKQSAVIANDGSVFPGEVIAGNGAFQIHLALKNKSGGAVDPHAGHSH
ncbi:MAG: efflux RND transporter periplasmic adaptor subunit [Pirellulales bacterium]